MKSLLTVLAFVSVSAAADYAVLENSYLGSCGGNVTVIGSSVDVRANECKTVKVISAYGVELAVFKLNDSYNGITKFSGNIQFDYSIQSALVNDGYIYLTVTSGSGAHQDTAKVNWVREVIVQNNISLPAGWSYQMTLDLQCGLFDHTGAEVTVMNTWDSCLYGDTLLPQGWSTAYSTAWNDNNCYVWMNNYEHTPNAVRQNSCR